jgi:transglutaminase-like putative cysteine protease
VDNENYAPNLLIRVGYEIAFRFSQPTAVLMLLYVHPSRSASLRRGERIQVEPAVPLSAFIDSFGNRCGRVFVPAGRVVFRNEALVEDSGEPDPQVPDAQQHDVRDLPEDVLQFLLPSRYCEVDSELKDVAYSLVTSAARGWPRVQAVCNFAHQHVRFDYQQARANRTALETFREKVGVCRDFTHLAVTLCRSLNIPARYCTGYLGDIGIPEVPYPMDFSAWFEVFLDGKWWAFDARHNVPRIGRILMARGRDAADTALTTTFGANELDSFTVWTDEVAEAGKAASQVE